MPSIKELNEHLIAQFNAARAFTSAEVEAALRAVPRHIFVDQYYDFEQTPPHLIEVDPDDPTQTQLEKIYSDEALVSHRDPHPTSSTSQPFLVAQMLEVLQLKEGMQVLEIGAGTGWNAALMGHMVGAEGRVYSIDIQVDVARRARRHVRRQGAQNVAIVKADGGHGYSDGAPYDRIITTVGCAEMAPPWLQQLRDGGVLVLTLQDLPGEASCLLLSLRKVVDHLEGEVVGLPGFMGLQGAYGVEVVLDAVAEARLARARDGRQASLQPTPWQAWPAEAHRAIARELVFFAALEGLAVEAAGNQFIIASPESESICIAAEEHLEVYGGDEAYRAFAAVAQKWTELGAPPRSAYRVEIWPSSRDLSSPENGWVLRRQHTQMVFHLK